ncbi:hypothetical protein [Methanoregula sp.]|uniref:hypothetical protein n=1 Tax=Methanoregula sp. TaxID=2052170 RepID=UPI0035616F98
MKRQVSPRVVLLAFVLLLLVALAGCTSQAPPATPAPSATPAPPASQVPGKTLSTIEPAQMALEPSEITGNFTLIKKSERNESMTRAWQLNQGWKKGYSAAFKRNDPGHPDLQIGQFISVYPRENASKMVDYLVEGNYLDLARIPDADRMNYSITELPPPGIGDSSRAIIKLDKNDPETMYLIAFSRYDVFEEIWGNGTAAEYETMKQAAAMAASKIT